MKKTTKKEIQSILRTQNSTLIFKIAKQCGVDVNSKSKVYDFIVENSPSKKVSINAYNLSIGSSLSKQRLVLNVKPLYQPIFNAIGFAKEQNARGNSSYSKILIEGNGSIYWSSPEFGHKDYNKSIAFENNEKNRIIAKKINSFLGY